MGGEGDVGERVGYSSFGEIVGRVGEIVIERDRAGPVGIDNEADVVSDALAGEIDALRICEFQIEDWR